MSEASEKGDRSDAYRRRLKALRKELKQASELQNASGTARAEQEIGFLSAELSKSVGVPAPIGSQIR